MIYICIPTTEERREQTDRLIASIREHTKDIQHSIVLYENQDGGWVPAVHNVLSGIDGFAILLGSDCLVSEGWLKILWERFNKVFPNHDGIAQPFDEINNGVLCQHPLGHSKVILEYLHKGYVHNFSDNEMTDRLLRDGKYLYVPESKVEHLHWVNKKAPMDKTYQQIMSSYARDKKLYEARASAGFPSEEA